MSLLYRMKFLIGVLTPILAFIGTYANAQQENWDTYMAKFGAKPGSVLVDMGLVSSAPLKLYPYIVVTGPKAKICNEANGIPDNESINKLETILNVTSGILSGATPKKLVGTFTYNCERLNYYYVKDTTAVRNAITRMYANHYSDIEYTIKIKPDPLWVTYRTFLFPDSTAQSWMSINKQLITMLQDGDNLATKRPIAHTLYFMTDSGRNAFNQFAERNGYKVTDVNDAKDVALSFECTVARESYVISDSIMVMQSELKPMAKKLKGYYKGWDATIK